MMIITNRTKVAKIMAATTKVFKPSLYARSWAAYYGVVPTRSGGNASYQFAWGEDGAIYLDVDILDTDMLDLDISAAERTTRMNDVWFMDVVFESGARSLYEIAERFLDEFEKLGVKVGARDGWKVFETEEPK